MLYEFALFVWAFWSVKHRNTGWTKGLSLKTVQPIHLVMQVHKLLYCQRNRKRKMKTVIIYSASCHSKLVWLSSAEYTTRMLGSKQNWTQLTTNKKKYIIIIIKTLRGRHSYLMFYRIKIQTGLILFYFFIIFGSTKAPKAKLKNAFFKKWECLNAQVTWHWKVHYNSKQAALGCFKKKNFFQCSIQCETVYCDWYQTAGSLAMFVQSQAPCTEWNNPLMHAYKTVTDAWLKISALKLHS